MRWLKYIELYCTAVPVNVSLCCFFFFNCFYLKKKGSLHLQLNVLYAFKKYRVSSLRGLSVCVCVCVCVRLFFRPVFWEKKKRNVRTLNQFPPDPKAGIPGCLYLSLLWFAVALDKLRIWFESLVPAGAAVAVNYDDCEYNQPVTLSYMCWLNIRGNRSCPHIRMSEFLCRVFTWQFLVFFYWV